MSLLIRGGRVLDPATGCDRIRDILLCDDRISTLDPEEDQCRGSTLLDATGLWILPAGVALDTSIPGEGFSQAALMREARAAVAGGMGHLVMSANNTLCANDIDALLALQGLARPASARVHFQLPLTRNLAWTCLTDLAALCAQSIPFASPGPGMPQRLDLFRRTLVAAGQCGIRVAVHPLNHALTEGPPLREGATADRMGLGGWPVVAETIAVATLVELALDTGCKLHLSRIGCARSLQCLQSARDDGLDITADVGIHHLFYGDIDVAGFRADLLVDPPFGTQEDREQLRQALRLGAIDALCAHHTPQPMQSGPMSQARSGFAALETCLPLTLRMVEEGLLEPLQAVALLTTGPARVAGLPEPALAAGKAADLVLVDPDAPWFYQAASAPGAGRNSPCEGWQFSHRVHTTILSGAVVYRGQAPC